MDSVELVLAVEDVSALAGEGGHAEPAESPRQARRFLLAKGSGPPFSSHPHSEEVSPRQEDGGSKCSLKPSFNLEL